MYIHIERFLRKTTVGKSNKLSTATALGAVSKTLNLRATARKPVALTYGLRQSCATNNCGSGSYKFDGLGFLILKS